MSDYFFVTVRQINFINPPRLENWSDTGFDPIWAGTNATGVPKEAIIVTNADRNIQWSDVNLWGARQDVQYYSPGLRSTTTNGTSLTYVFEGVAIW